MRVMCSLTLKHLAGLAWENLPVCNASNVGDEIPSSPLQDHAAICLRLKRMRPMWFGEFCVSKIKLGGLSVRSSGNLKS